MVMLLISISTKNIVKIKKRIENGKENWEIFMEVHTAIVERSVFEKILENNVSIHTRQGVTVRLASCAS